MNNNECVEIFWSGPGLIPLGLDKRTNSTLLLKQPNSLEVDRAALRKTRSEENMGSVAPRIIIGNPPPPPPPPLGCHHIVIVVV